jgi:hypothetical protein
MEAVVRPQLFCILEPSPTHIVHVITWMLGQIRGAGMTPEDAVSHALDGNAILFTGAGFSWGARNIKNDQVPSGRTLARDLLAHVGYSSTDGPLDKAAAAYLRRKSPRDLVNLLIPTFTVKEVSESHKIIAALPFRRIYTTNYDTVFEEARRSQGILCNSIEGADQPRDHIGKPNLLIHINGAITLLTEDKLGTSFKLVSESYAADSFENSGWAFHFRNDIRTARAVIFVGYSMYDLDIRRAIFSEDISNKCLFVTAPLTDDNALEAEDLSDLGVVAAIGVDSFADTVKAIQGTYIPQEPELLLAEWARIEALAQVSASPSDGEVLDFLVAGDVSNSLASEACGPNKHNYIVARPALDEMLAEVLQKNARVLLAGELGTGKSFICDSLAQLALRHGWDVFKLDGGSKDEIGEAESICAIPGKKLLLVENYQRHMELLEWFSETRPEDVSLVLTARTNVHELFEKEVYDLFEPVLRVHDISTFSRPETHNAVALFDRYGLWGDRAAWSLERKQQFVTHRCSSQLPSLLVDVLKSRHISDRYKELLRSVPNRSDVEAALICAFSLEVMGYAPKTSHIQELLANTVNWARLRTQTELKSIIDFDSHAVHAKSSVLALHLLHEVFPAKKTIATLVGMAREADDRRNARDFYEILNGMMRYRNLSAVLPETSRLESTINFYEGVKNLSATKRNPQFWLQYAIACLAFGRLERAELYFNAAYALVKPGYDTFQIDNHFARLQLEKALQTPGVDDGIVLVDKARIIILQQMGKEIRYYPYRVASGLFRFYERFKSSFTPLHRKYFVRAFEEIKKRSESTTGQLRNNRYVIECRAKATEALEELKAS